MRLQDVEAALREIVVGLEPEALAAAAAADADAEGELRGVPRADGLAGRRDTCRRVKAEATPDERARYRALHASGGLRHWNDPGGAGRLDGRFTPEVLAELLVALEPFEAEAFRGARAEGRRESFDAYRADALVALARAGRDGTGGGAPGARHTVHVAIDHAPLVRGQAEV